jgi:hypothetical protein
MDRKDRAEFRRAETRGLFVLFAFPVVELLSLPFRYQMSARNE